MKRLLLLLFLLLGIGPVWVMAQSEIVGYDLLLKHQSVRLTPLALPLPQVSEAELVEGHYYRIIQFEELPDQALHQELRDAGVKLLSYLPHLAYFARIPVHLPANLWLEWPIRSIASMAPQWKMAPELSAMGIDQAQAGTVDINLRYFAPITSTYVRQALEQRGYQIELMAKHSPLLRLRVAYTALEKLSQLPFVSYLEKYNDDFEPEHRDGRVLHRNNLLDSPNLLGPHYDGSGIATLVRDDGNIGPHIDFQGRLFQLDGVPEGGDHGDRVGGILAGAGNLDPYHRGCAAGAELYVLPYTSDFMDQTMDLHLEQDVVITNSSYGNGCNGGYTLISQIVDEQMYQNPSLVHVFSAGNSGGTNCGFGAGNNWGNITGGHKQGKNVIATGNLTARGDLYISSSRGPASDGRIKPDLCAHGHGQRSTTPNHQYSNFSGTSAAAPGIAGSMAQLYQAYRELNAGATAPAALIKALLLNTSNDLSTPGPDFRTGWGQVNAYRALRGLEEQRYASDSIDLAQKNIHTIDIPAGTKQVKVMLYWADPAANPQVQQSLVNDLDLQIIAPDNSEHLPWILDHFPDPTRLNAPAIRGIDRINNMEQITFDDPATGVYEIQVTGTVIPLGKVAYYWTYEIIEEEIMITYPNGGESWEPGSIVPIHWDAPPTDQDFTIAYSEDNGGNWKDIESAGPTTRQVQWSVPEDLLSGKALIRVSHNSWSDQSDTTFSIAPRPEPRLLSACLTEMRIEWPAIPEAVEYEIYRLGNRFMEKVATTVDNTWGITYADLSDGVDIWLAVRAIGSDWQSERSIAVNNPSGDFFDCPFQDDLAINFIQNPNQSTIQACGTLTEDLIINLRNNGSKDQTNFDLHYQVDDEPVVVERYTSTIAAGETAFITFNQRLNIDQPGPHQIETWVSIPGDENPFNNQTASSFHLNLLGATQSPDVNESFAQIPPPGWLLENPDSLRTWESYSTIGPSGQQATVLRLPHFGYTSFRAIDRLVSIPIDLSNSITSALSFNWAYAPRGAANQADSFRIELHTDCGNTFLTSIFGAAGSRLATHPISETAWEPQGAEDWQQQTIDLTAFKGQEIVIKLVTRNYRGNHFYLSDFSLYESTAIPEAQISSRQDKACIEEAITFSSSSTGIGIEAYRWDFGPNATPATADGKGPWDIVFNTTDTQRVQLWLNNPHGEDSVVLEVPVVNPPLPDFNVDQDGATITIVNQSTEGTSYLWDFGDGKSSTVENPVHSYELEGTFDIQLTVYSDYCSPVSQSKQIDISLSSSTRDQVDQFAVQVYPNPNSGSFQIQIADFTQRQLTCQLYDVVGKKMWEEQFLTKAGRSNYPITLNDLHPGLYFLQIKDQEKSSAIRVLVQ